MTPTSRLFAELTRGSAPSEARRVRERTAAGIAFDPRAVTRLCREVRVSSQALCKSEREEETRDRAEARSDVRGSDQRA